MDAERQTGQPLEHALAKDVPARVMLAHLAEGDLASARFVWKRTRDPSPEAAAAWRVTQALWNRQYGEAHAALCAGAWSAALVPHVAALETALRQRTARLLARAYAAISVHDAAAHLGLDEAQCAQYCTATLGWTLDGAATLRPRPIAEPKDRKPQLQQLDHLATYALHLDQRL
eukprot:Unigene12086_Nuclearia_a/m.36761 Unigene12086_Nuclearia_a/g.36761  ORF Unigene12086_Nuclearia_a/g.36761 Unigene12086_Nuclearia_a/m.36761 type:complete len:174 (+) Unigene12086_Nuclearia_a:1-522(+)